MGELGRALMGGRRVSALLAALVLAGLALAAQVSAGTLPSITTFELNPRT